jgi:hypothetical protein
VTFTAPGTDEYLCTVTGHADAGMKGLLTVVGYSGRAAIRTPGADATRPVVTVEPSTQSTRWPLRTCPGGVESRCRPSGPTEGGADVTIHIESETDEHRIERCDHEGTTEPLGGLTSVSVCSECGATWPTRFGIGAATACVVSKSHGADVAD